MDRRSTYGGYTSYTTWEDVSVKTITTHTASRYGRITQSVLVLSIPASVDSSQNSKEIIFSVFCGRPESGIMQWEYIRTFMEIGPDYCPASNLHATEINTLLKQFKSKDIRGTLWTIFRIITLGSMLVDVYDYWKYRHIESVTMPDVLNWSVSISEENWAIRSKSLSKSISVAQLLINSKDSGFIELTNE